MSEVLNWLLPLCECASDKSRDLAFGLLLDVRAHNPSMCERLIDEIRPSVMPVLKTRLAPPLDNASTLSLSGKRLAPLPSIGSGLPGSMPDLSAEGDEIIAVHGTPPDANSRARARTTATQLGARSAPANKKKASRASAASKARRAADLDDPDGLLAEAMDAVGEEVPRPVRLASGTAGVSSSKHRLAVGAGGGDDVSKFLTEEQLMEQILEATR